MGTEEYEEYKEYKEYEESVDRSGLPTSPRRLRLPTPPCRPKLQEAMSDRPGGYVGQVVDGVDRSGAVNAACRNGGYATVPILHWAREASAWRSDVGMSSGDHF